MSMAKTFVLYVRFVRIRKPRVAYPIGFICLAIILVQWLSSVIIQFKQHPDYEHAL